MRIDAARCVVLLEREAKALKRGPRRGGIGRREHERAVSVLGNADDAGDVDRTLGQRGSDARQRTGLVVQLDREPHRQRAPPVPRMVADPVRFARCCQRSPTA
jgi:hypothetical protein